MVSDRIQRHEKLSYIITMISNRWFLAKILQYLLQTQDRFHEEDAKELRRLRSGMAALAKTCRAFHLKLKKAERKSGELKIKNDELKAAVKSGASLESSSSR